MSPEINRYYREKPVKRPDELALRFRIPGRMADPSQYVNGLIEAGLFDAAIGIGTPGFIGIMIDCEGDLFEEVARIKDVVWSVIDGAELVFFNWMKVS